MVLDLAVTPGDRSRVDVHDLSPEFEAALGAFEAYLVAEAGKSANTVRAYVTDLRLLFEHAQRMHRQSPAEIDLPVLRSWLARQGASGAARSTMARRAAAARRFT